MIKRAVATKIYWTDRIWVCPWAGVGGTSDVSTWPLSPALDCNTGEVSVLESMESEVISMSSKGFKDVARTIVGILLGLPLLVVSVARASHLEIPSHSTPREPIGISVTGEWRESSADSSIRYRVDLENKGMEFTGVAMVNNDRDIGTLEIKGRYFLGGGFEVEVFRAGELISTVSGTFEGHTFSATTEALDKAGKVTDRRTGHGSWDPQTAVNRAVRPR